MGGVPSSPDEHDAADVRPAARRGRSVPLFLWVWLQIGFVTGTMTLLGPVRWISDRAESAGWAGGSEDLAVRGAIVLFVLVSAALAVGTTVALRRTRPAGRLIALGGLAAIAAATVWLWMTPAAMGSFQATEVTVSGRFTFGPYPTRARLEALQRQGYRGVVSLLHPAVVPFEPKLLADERKAVAEVGLEFVHAPMLPWVGDNADALARIRELAEAGGGRYYVHCYLGKDRVGVVQRLLASVPASGLVPVRSGSVRLDGVASLERGPVHELDPSLFLTPFPTDEELFGYFQGGGLEQVLSLLDPERPEDVPWIERETAALRQVGVGLRLEPLPWMPYRAARALEVVEVSRELTRPAAVHAFRADGPAWEAFLLAWETGLPPLPPSLFLEPMQGGRPALVGVNVAVGPRPAPAEFGDYLAPRGLRALIHVGDGTRQAALADAEAARRAGLDWRAVRGDAGPLIDLVSEGGPWYVYGPGLGVVQGELDDALRDPGTLLRRLAPVPQIDGPAGDGP